MNNYLASPGTYSKSPLAWGFEPGLWVEHASGCRLYLNDDKPGYIDWCAGLGSNLMGYWNTPFLNSPTYAPSLPHRLEYTVAEKLCHLLGHTVPGWSPDAISCRFAKTGSDVTTMAVRLARAVTGRNIIICFDSHYHGWHDWTIARVEPAYGIPYPGVQFNHWLQCEWGNKECINNVTSKWGATDIAAIIFEQPITDPDPGWYKFLRQWCNDNGALLVADEVVTGLRYAPGGACELYGIEPDLVCVGKALGNGLPISALIGKREYMDWFNRIDPVFCSSTFWGETTGLAAADYVLDNWDDTRVDQLWKTGNDLITGLKEAGWDVVGHPPRSLLQFENEYERAFFIHGMRERRVLMNRPNFPTLAHTSVDVMRTVEAAKEVGAEMLVVDKSVIEAVMKDKLPRVLFSNR